MGGGRKGGREGEWEEGGRVGGREGGRKEREGGEEVLFSPCCVLYLSLDLSSLLPPSLLPLSLPLSLLPSSLPFFSSRGPLKGSPSEGV